MSTPYLIGISLIGGLITLFIAAGWSSYKEQKLPENPILFRWFVAGVVLAAIVGYAWMFGAGGDPSALVGSIGESLEIKKLMEGLSAAVQKGGAAAVVEAATESAVAAANAAADKVKEALPELTVGMPAF